MTSRRYSSFLLLCFACNADVVQTLSFQKNSTDTVTTSNTIRNTSSNTDISVIQQHFDDAWIEIETLLSSNKKLGPQFIRMVFHDCIGGCDGCIDIDNPGNVGIEPAMDILQPIVQRYSIDGSISRADIWALSSMVVLNQIQRPIIRRRKVDFTMNWYGRIDCENTGTICYGTDNSTVVECSMKKGSHHIFPHNHMYTHELYQFFYNEFGFDERETITIMGAHTIGALREEDVNISAKNGWDVTNTILDIGFYRELCGSRNRNASIYQLVNGGPNWHRSMNQYHTIHFWKRSAVGLNIVMLNSDMALVRQLDDTNMNQITGEVSCTFQEPSWIDQHLKPLLSSSDDDDVMTTTTTPVCPYVESALRIMAELFGNPQVWLYEFRTVFDRMITNGYIRPTTCHTTPCLLLLLEK